MRLPLTVGVGWGVGTLVSSTLLYSANTLLLRYLTDEIGIAAAMAGLLIAISKVYDAAIDPFVGALSDRSRSAAGRRRPFLLAGGIGCALALVALFTVPPLASEWLLHAWVLLALLFYSTAYTVFNVPYLAMPAEMTRDPHERSLLISYRVYASSAAMLLASTVGPMLLVSFGGGRTAHGWMALTLAPVILLATLVCYTLTRPAPFTSGVAASPHGLLHDFGLIMRNRPFMWLLALKVTMLVGITAQAATAAFFTKLVLRVPDTSLGLFFLAQTLGAIVSLTGWLWLARRVGKTACYATGAVVFALGSLSWWFAGAGEPLALVLARAAVVGVGGGAIFLMSNSLLPDTIEHDHARTGLRREGTLAAVFTFVEQCAHAIAAALIGLLLGALGYIAGQGGGVAQPASAIFGIVLCFSVIPAAAVLLSIWPALRLRIEPAA